MSRKLRERVTIVRTNKAGMERSSNLNYFPILFSIFMAGKLLIMWMVIVALDFACGFRLEYFWPVWLMLQSVADAYKYQGIVSYTIKTHLEFYYKPVQSSRHGLVLIVILSSSMCICLTLVFSFFCRASQYFLSVW